MRHQGSHHSKLGLPVMVPWLVMWWAVVGSQGASLGTHTAPAGGRCTPCNATVRVESRDLPAVGFLCPGAPHHHHPYTCLVFFDQPHNLTIHLHHFYPDQFSVSWVLLHSCCRQLGSPAGV